MSGSGQFTIREPAIIQVMSISFFWLEQSMTNTRDQRCHRTPHKTSIARGGGGGDIKIPRTTDIDKNGDMMYSDKSSRLNF